MCFSYFNGNLNLESAKYNTCTRSDTRREMIVDTDDDAQDVRAVDKDKVELFKYVRIKLHCL